MSKHGEEGNILEALSAADIAMKEIAAIITPFKLEDVEEALALLGIAKRKFSAGLLGRRAKWRKDCPQETRHFHHMQFGERYLSSELFATDAT